MNCISEIPAIFFFLERRMGTFKISGHWEAHLTSRWQKCMSLVCSSAGKPLKKRLIMLCRNLVIMPIHISEISSRTFMVKA